MTTSKLCSGALLLALACTPEADPPAPRLLESEPAAAPAEPEHHLIRYVCEGFEQAVAEGAPAQRLLSTSTKHAIELGGERVELASRRWALTPAHELLLVLDRYEREAEPDPRRCAGLRAQLEQMSRRSASQ